MFQVFTYSMFVSTMAFHAKVSDPAIGGTYMTLLNTMANLAGTWISTLALWLVDNVSFKDCEGVSDQSLDCDTMQQLKVRNDNIIVHCPKVVSDCIREIWLFN